MFRDSSALIAADKRALTLPRVYDTFCHLFLLKPDFLYDKCGTLNMHQAPQKQFITVQRVRTSNSRHLEHLTTFYTAELFAQMKNFIYVTNQAKVQSKAEGLWADV